MNFETGDLRHMNKLALVATDALEWSGQAGGQPGLGSLKGQCER